MGKNRYVFLDGIRGIAALFIVIRHTSLFWTFEFRHSYLAVDLFFILSGFVIAHAYESKLASGRISTKGFFQLRLIRLYPIFLFSVAITALLTLAELHIRHPGKLPISGEFLIAMLTMVFLVPTHYLANSSLFAFNGVYWSLAYELLANVAYAFARPVLSNKVLIWSVAVLMCLEGAVALSTGSIDQGFAWGLAPFVTATVRSLYGVSMGLLLYRNQERIFARFKHPGMPWLAVATICAVLGTPYLGRFDRLADFVAVALIFPVCVLIAARGTSRFARPLTTLGAASYGIYVFHVPIATFSSYLGWRYAQVLAPVSGACFLIGLLGFAIVVDRLYDIPVRAWLTERRNRNLALQPKVGMTATTK